MQLHNEVTRAHRYDNRSLRYYQRIYAKQQFKDPRCNLETVVQIIVHVTLF